jgi:hypothetical protein
VPWDAADPEEADDGAVDDADIVVPCDAADPEEADDGAVDGAVEAAELRPDISDAAVSAADGIPPTFESQPASQPSGGTYGSIPSEKISGTSGRSPRSSGRSDHCGSDLPPGTVPGAGASGRKFARMSPRGTV